MCAQFYTKVLHVFDVLDRYNHSLRCLFISKRLGGVRIWRWRLLLLFLILRFIRNLNLQHLCDYLFVDPGAKGETHCDVM